MKLKYYAIHSGVQGIYGWWWRREVKNYDLSDGWSSCHEWKSDWMISLMMIASNWDSEPDGVRHKGALVCMNWMEWMNGKKRRERGLPKKKVNLIKNHPLERQMKGMVNHDHIDDHNHDGSAIIGHISFGMRKMVMQWKGSDPSRWSGNTSSCLLITLEERGRETGCHAHDVWVGSTPGHARRTWWSPDDYATATWIMPC